LNLSVKTPILYDSEETKMSGKLQEHVTRKKTLALAYNKRKRKPAKPVSGKGKVQRWAGPSHGSSKRSWVKFLSKEHSARGLAFLEAAQSAGYLKGEKSERVSVRVSRVLISTAKMKSGIKSPTMLLEYALSKVALEDDFGSKLLARKGSIPKSVDF
jgi:hypothetical protein